MGPLVQFEGAQAVICGGQWEVDRGERACRWPGTPTTPPGAGKGATGAQPQEGVQVAGTPSRWAIGETLPSGATLWSSLDPWPPPRCRPRRPAPTHSQRGFGGPGGNPVPLLHKTSPSLPMKQVPTPSNGPQDPLTLAPYPLYPSFCNTPSWTLIPECHSFRQELGSAARPPHPPGSPPLTRRPGQAFPLGFPSPWASIPST